MIYNYKVMINTFRQTKDVDRKLLQCIDSKDIGAFQLLYKETSPRMFSLILYIVKQRSSAEQVLLQTYLQIWRDASKNSFDQGRAIDRMLGIAKNNAIEALQNNLSSKNIKTSIIISA